MVNEAFRITKRQYKIVLDQGIANLPQESGGFLGGSNFVIQAVLPVFNQFLYDRTATFGFTSEDIERAQLFFQKHGFKFYGLYHTHPKGVAYPSTADIQSGQKYHFILSLQDQKNPVFNGFHVDGNTITPIPIIVISDSGYHHIDLQSEGMTEDKQNPFKTRTPKEEAELLYDLIEKMKSEEPTEYPKMPPKDIDLSDFSTLA